MSHWRVSMIGILSLCGVAAAGEARLQPGVPVEFEVPSAPPSLAILFRNNDDKAVRMTIKLPRDYEASRSYPVCVFLSGGDGGMGGELWQAEPFLGEQGYILCNLPLFKQYEPGSDLDRQLSISPADGPYALAGMRALLDELRRRVPNIDETRSVLAGFSNGANAVALVLWAGDPDLLARFGNYVLIEGGFWLGSDRDASTGAQFRRADFSGARGKRVLVVYGAEQKPADRVPWIRSAQQTVAALRAAGVEASEQAMPNVGHDFPAAEMDRARAWLLGDTP